MSEHEPRWWWKIDTGIAHLIDRNGNPYVTACGVRGRFSTSAWPPGDDHCKRCGRVWDAWQGRLTAQAEAERWRAQVDLF